MGNLNIGAALNTVSTLANLPVDKGTIYATLSAASTISLSDTMMIGQNLTVIIKPTADFTLPIPSSGSWASTCGTSLALTSGENCQLTITCTANGAYTISSPTHGLNQKIATTSTGLFGEFGEYTLFGLTYDGQIRVAYNMDSGDTLSYSNPKIANKPDLSHVIIGSNVKRLFDTFNQCTILKSVSIPNSVTNIDQATFKECQSLLSITIPNSVTSIGISGFCYCSGMETITIPSSVTNIGTYAFANCRSLKSAVLENCAVDIDRTFFVCSALTSVNLGNNVKSITSLSFSGCTSLKTINIPNTVTSIGASAFTYCISLTAITIPDSVTSLEAYTFHHCVALTSATLSNNLTSIDRNAFYYCVALSAITIPSGITRIGNSAFGSCLSLTSVTYKGVTYTSQSALETALMNNGVFLGTQAFYNTGLGT